MLTKLRNKAKQILKYNSIEILKRQRTSVYLVDMITTDILLLIKQMKLHKCRKCLIEFSFKLHFLTATLRLVMGNTNNEISLFIKTIVLPIIEKSTFGNASKEPKNISYSKTWIRANFRNNTEANVQFK